MKMLSIIGFLAFNLNAIPADWFLNYEYCVTGNAPLEVCNITREIVSLQNKMKYVKNEKEKKTILCYSMKYILNQHSRLSDSWQKSLEKIEIDGKPIIKNSELEKFYEYVHKC